MSNFTFIEIFALQFTSFDLQIEHEKCERQILLRIEILHKVLHNLLLNYSYIKY